MNLLIPLLLLAINPHAPLETRYPGATEVFTCKFDAGGDQDFDRWPDGWTRRRGPEFPSYVPVALSDEPAPEGRSLRVELNGGAAVAYSPPIPVLPRYSYVLEGCLKTVGLQHDEAFFSLTLLDSERKPLETCYSEKVTSAPEWQKFRLGPISPRGEEARLAVIGLHLEPGRKADLTGSASFADLWLARLPRMALAVEGRHYVVTDPSQITIRCTASGFAEDQPKVSLVLEDVFGQHLAEVQPTLEIQRPRDLPELTSDNADEQQTPVGITRWKPPIPGPGYYQVWGLMQGSAGLVERSGVSVAVIEPAELPKSGDFGWSLPHGAPALTLPELAQLLGHAGVSWVKYPLWLDVQTSDETVAQLISFNERLSSRGITLVGLLHQPPAKLCEHFEHPEKVSAAEVFSSNPELWYPSLEMVMMRLATQVRWWQLGSDQDTSFVDYPNLPQKIGQIKGYLDRVGQNVNTGFGWNWMAELPSSGSQAVPWRFVSLSATPPLTEKELQAYLAVTRPRGVKRWVVLEPLSDERYSMEVRTRDLVHRMMAAKIHGADVSFVPDPFDSHCGLLSEEGAPGVLLLPWRTTSLMLAGSQSLGSLQLPSGSPNQVFGRNGTATMVVWNPEPVREAIFPGSDVQQVDLWSHRRVPVKEDNRQVIEVGPLPTFVTGLDLSIVRWQQSLSFAKECVPSVFGQRHQNSVQFTNRFNAGVSGEIKLVMPEIWAIKPDRAEFQLAAGEQFRMPFEMMLPYTATSGRHRVRVDFVVRADKTYQFSAYRTIDVGMGDVYVECTTHLKENGDLEVEQRMHNESSQPVSFRCELYVPDRKRLVSDVVQLGQGSTVNLYRVSQGQELLGKTLWLQAKELGGSRLLNYRFLAQP